MTDQKPNPVKRVAHIIARGAGILWTMLWAPYDEWKKEQKKQGGSR